MRQTFREINKSLPVLETRTLDAQVENSLGQQRMIATLSTAFGLLALVLTAVGIYGATAYSAAGRTNEIGVRMAVGAQPLHVIWLILRKALALIGIGFLLGLPFAIAETHWLKSFLFGVQQIDPLAILSAALLILALATLAGFVPARRASRIDPMRALRHE